MASYVNWLEPGPWEDDGGTALTSLERRQRRQRETKDVNAFYSSLGFLFFIITGLLVWSEVSAFYTSPSRALTGAFALELVKFGAVACSQLKSLYYHVGNFAWTLNAVVYGPEFAKHGGLAGAQWPRVAQLFCACCCKQNGWVAGSGCGSAGVWSCLASLHSSHPRLFLCSRGGVYVYALGLLKDALARNCTHLNGLLTRQAKSPNVHAKLATLLSGGLTRSTAPHAQV